MSQTAGVKWAKSLQSTIGFVMLGMTLLAMVVFTGIKYFVDYSRINQSLQEMSEAAASRLSVSLVMPIWALENKTIDDLLRSEMLERQLAGIVIKAHEDGDVISAMVRDDNWNIMSVDKNLAADPARLEKRFSDDLMTISKEIHFADSLGEEQIGVVDVYVTPEFMRKELFVSTITDDLTMGAVSLMLFIAIFITLRRVFIRPTLQITEFAEQMSLGKLDKPLAIRSKNEIGMLADALERTRVSLVYALRRIKKK